MYGEHRLIAEPLADGSELPLHVLDLADHSVDHLRAAVERNVLMVRVLNEEKSVHFYKTAFDLDIADRFEFDGFTLIYLRNSENDFEVELTINHGRTDPYTHGDGYGHIALAVDDIDAEYERFSAAGLPPSKYQKSSDGAAYSINRSKPTMRQEASSAL